MQNLSPAAPSTEPAAAPTLNKAAGNLWLFVATSLVNDFDPIEDGATLTVNLHGDLRLRGRGLPAPFGEVAVADIDRDTDPLQLATQLRDALAAIAKVFANT